MVWVTDILSHSHALNIVFTLPDDRNLHCCDSGWRNVLFCHLAIESFLFRVSTQALIPLMLNHFGKQSNQGLEVHGAPISKEDINQKFLRSLPPSWNQIALIMRNKPDIDEIFIWMTLQHFDTNEMDSHCLVAGEILRLVHAEELVKVPSTPCAHDVAMLTVRVKKSGRNQGKRSYGDNGRSNAPTNESSSQALVAQDGLGGYDWSNDFEIEPVNYALMGTSPLTSPHQVLLTMRARLEIQGYELALESLDSRILGHEKNELVWGENMKSSKNLDELLNSQMSARDKTGLGYGTQLNEMSNNSETDSEISLSVCYVRSSDEESTPTNDMLSKADGYHAVPPLITGNFLTPRADISFAGLDEYVIRKKIIESKTTDLNTKTSETVGKTNEVNTQKPKTVYESVNRDKVIIEDWNSDDEDDVSEVQTVSLVKTNKSQTIKPRVDKCHTPPRRKHEVELHGYHYNTMASTIEILKGKENNHRGHYVS
ncbi:hypothetical protein Tco_0493447 [Tanacetum coccineum]